MTKSHFNRIEEKESRLKKKLAEAREYKKSARFKIKYLKK